MTIIFNYVKQVSFFSRVLGVEVHFARENADRVGGGGGGGASQASAVAFKNPFKTEEHERLLDDISKIHDKYQAIKNALKDEEAGGGAGGGKSVNSSLSLASADLPERVRKRGGGAKKERNGPHMASGAAAPGKL
jgi:hypothetical protein